MDQRNYTGRLECKQCRLTFRQQVPPENSMRLICSDCGHYLDTWDEGDVAVTAKGPHPDQIKYADNYTLYQAEIYADVTDTDDIVEYFRPHGDKR